jgi:glycerophosphoryl diester phosphodiesterase
MGHRGARDEAPENTLAGFAHARAIGVPAVEFDVQLSKDLQPVVIHDLTVDRTTDGSGPVKRLTRRQLQRLDARSVHRAADITQAGVPHLHEVLEVLRRGPYLSVEIKTDTPRRLAKLLPLVADALRAFRLLQCSTITSFDLTALEIAREVAPRLPRGYIGAWTDPDWLDGAKRVGARTACVRLEQSSDAMADRIHAAGLSMHGWMVNDQAALAVAERRGSSHATTDRPTWLMAALNQENAERSHATDPSLTSAGLRVASRK